MIVLYISLLFEPSQALNMYKSVNLVTFVISQHFKNINHYLTV